METKEKSTIESILSDKYFQEELKKAIERGKYTDYHFNGEEEYPVDAFNVDAASAAAMEVVKEYFGKRHDEHRRLVAALSKLEDIISGIEAQADNKGIDLSEARHWWSDARKLLDELECQKSEK